MMKRGLVVLFLTVITIILAYFASAECLHNNNDYAFETVINKQGSSYNINLIKNAQNTIIKNNKIIFLSQVNPGTLTMLSEVNGAISGLSVRLQIPTNIQSKSSDHLQLAGTVSQPLFNNFNYLDWEMDCSSNLDNKNCILKKDNIKIKLAYSSNNNYLMEIDTYGSFPICGEGMVCTGICLKKSDYYCLPKEVNKNLQDIFTRLNLTYSTGYDPQIRKFDLSLSTEDVIDVISDKDPSTIDFQKAISQELIWLRDNKIINLSSEDIEDISFLAKAGKAGNNNRVVYASDKQGNQRWVYYDESLSPEINQVEDCSEITSSSIPKEKVILNKVSGIPFYIPLIIIAVIFLIILIVLISISKKVHKREEPNIIHEEKKPGEKHHKKN